jgi:hypothetical protein
MLSSLTTPRILPNNLEVITHFKFLHSATPYGARCFKQIWKLGKVGKGGKVGKVGKIGKVVRVGKVGKVGKEGKENRLRE